AIFERGTGTIVLELVPPCQLLKGVSTALPLSSTAVPPARKSGDASLKFETAAPF
ncbi:hypothetical protein PanWU01x14_108420, partial [Parasponia andersonii]